MIGASLLGIGTSESREFSFFWCYTFSFFGGVCSVLWRTHLLVLGTSFLGGYCVTSGIDKIFLNSGFTESVNNFFLMVWMDGDLPSPVSATQKVLLASWIILSLVGIVVQWKFTAHEVKR
eukprot:TRINITY_DN10969_c0_g1_i2.p2 TRINITY_DN10969_c0_g1~~TRINITY_DN10969_c0_g1_i2.p2  ORF type:complete len:120 (-),score=14.08 TRINITY_DN10969_c0_g1_i2:228-587(-)